MQNTAMEHGSKTRNYSPDLWFLLFSVDIFVTAETHIIGEWRGEHKNNCLISLLT